MLITQVSKYDVRIHAATAIPTSPHMCCFLTQERTLCKSGESLLNESFTEGDIQLVRNKRNYLRHNTGKSLSVP
jgi:hypothetical protein